jgi:hypothetical protein
MWRFQLEDDIIDDKIATSLLILLNTHDNYRMANQADLELLVQNSL